MIDLRSLFVIRKREYLFSFFKRVILLYFRRQFYKILINLIFKTIKSEYFATLDIALNRALN